MGTMPSSWKATFITLIPKRPDANEPSHLRPISLYTTLYRVICNILVHRLQLILGDLISPKQGVFIRGWSISDNIMIA